MKSIKPGRGPSMMGGVVSILIGAGGIIWTISAVGMGAPILFALFGVIFVIIAVVQAVYNFHNATSDNRYSEFDITDENEEPDPFNVRYGAPKQPTTPPADHSGGFCPYCGAPMHGDFAFCRKCGKALPKD